MREKFIVEFAPLPIPTEPPDAPGGFYFYLSPQWAAYVRGVVAILGFRRFWAKEPAKYDIILQWVYRLLDAIELPPGEVVEIPIFIPVGNQEEYECEECEMTCKCPNSVHYDAVAKAMYYLDENCQRVPIVLEASPGGLGTGAYEEAGSPTTPDLPPIEHDDPTYNAASAKKCALATAIVNEMWNVIAIGQSFDGINTFSEILGTVTGELATMFPEASAITLPAVITAQGFQKLLKEIGLTELEAKFQAIYENEAIKQELICDLVERMTLATLSAGSGTGIQVNSKDLVTAVTRFGVLVPDSEEAKELLMLFPITSWKEVITPKLASTLCGCEDFQPYVPPVVPPAEPDLDEFGIYGGELVGEILTSMSPLTSRAASSPRGVKVSEIKYTTQTYDAGDHQIADLFVMWEASEPITQVMWDTIWKYTGTPSDSENITEVHFKVYYATGETELWQLLPSFTGEISTNDSATPGIFFGSVNAQRFPWDDALQTYNAAFLGFHLKFKMQSDNTPASVPSGEISFVNFKAKATTGGNYRATFNPLQWVPKAL